MIEDPPLQSSGEAAAGVDRQVPTLAKAVSATFISRLTNIGSSTATSILLPLATDRTSVGLFFSAQILIGGLSTLGQFGLTFAAPGLLADSIARRDYGRSRALVKSIAGLCAAFALIAGIVGLTLLPALRAGVASGEPIIWVRSELLVIAAAMLMSMALVNTELVRAAHRVKEASALACLGGLGVAVFLAWTVLQGDVASLRSVLVAVCVGWGACVVASVMALAGTVLRWPATSGGRVSIGDLLRSTFPNFATACILFLLLNLDSLVILALSDARDMAVYGIALRVSALLLVPLGIANAAFAPLGVHARAIGDEPALRKMLRGVVKIGAGFAMLGYLLFASFGHTLISVWQSDYIEAYWLVLILGAGNIAHASGGAAGMILMVWGDQTFALKISAATGIVSVVLCVAGFLGFGLYGLAAGAAAGNALQVTAFVWRVRRRYGEDPSLRSLTAA